jgi:hypothetical protein
MTIEVELPDVIIEQAKPFEWPPFIKRGIWFAYDADGEAYFYRRKPTNDGRLWDVSSPAYCGEVPLWLDVPPLVGDWKDSLVQVK